MSWLPPLASQPVLCRITKASSRFCLLSSLFPQLAISKLFQELLHLNLCQMISVRSISSGQKQTEQVTSTPCLDAICCPGGKVPTGKQEAKETWGEGGREVGQVIEGATGHQVGVAGRRWSICAPQQCGRLCSPGFPQGGALSHPED